MNIQELIMKKLFYALLIALPLLLTSCSDGDSSSSSTSFDPLNLRYCNTSFDDFMHYHANLYQRIKSIKDNPDDIEFIQGEGIVGYWALDDDFYTFTKDGKFKNVWDNGKKSIEGTYKLDLNEITVFIPGRTYTYEYSVSESYLFIDD